jgi:hypothetical protein
MVHSVVLHGVHQARYHHRKRRDGRCHLARSPGTRFSEWALPPATGARARVWGECDDFCHVTVAERTSRANDVRSRASSATLTGNERRFVEHRNTVAPNGSSLVRLAVDGGGWLFPAFGQGSD